MRYYQAIEHNPDTKLRLGTLDEDGDRVVIYWADSPQQCIQHLIKHGVDAAEVHAMPNNYRPLPQIGRASCRERV